MVRSALTLAAESAMSRTARKRLLRDGMLLVVQNV
jgi:hypothetical protein